MTMQPMEKLWNANYVKVWLANFMIFFSFMLITPILPLYLDSVYQVDKDTIGWVLSGYTLTELLARPFSGFLVDSYPRKMVLLTFYFLFFAFFAGYLVAGSLTLFAFIRTLHGIPMGAVTVANSTCAIDVLHTTRRAEGIGYYGLSNNLASSIAPTAGLLLFEYTENYDALFLVALGAAATGFLINYSLRLPQKPCVVGKNKLSLDRFFLLTGWREGMVMSCFGLSYGVLASYLAIYGKEILGMTTETGLWFAVLSGGLILSRLLGARTLRQGKVVSNVDHGILISVMGFLLFAASSSLFAFFGAALIIGLGNGHIWPGMQTMFLNLAPHNQRGTANSTQLICWDSGMGLGVILGGIMIHLFNYNTAFWMAFFVNLLGLILYFTMARSHFISHKLRDA